MQLLRSVLDCQCEVVNFLRELLSSDIFIKHVIVSCSFNAALKHKLKQLTAAYRALKGWHTYGD